MSKLLDLSKLFSFGFNIQRSISSTRKIILGIETSCDDTGCAIVDTNGNILGEALHSQHQVHLNNGGIIPPIAQDLHRLHIENVVDAAFSNANLTVNDVSAVAATVKPDNYKEAQRKAIIAENTSDLQTEAEEDDIPLYKRRRVSRPLRYLDGDSDKNEDADRSSGDEQVSAFSRPPLINQGLPLSLEIGTKYAKYLCRLYKKPFIPIHHMKAHALTIRMNEKIDFPFLVLLISGGHCLLAVAQNIEDFLLLGETCDDAPGEAFDKVARRMKLKNIPEFSQLSGGQAIELAASKASDPLRYKFTIPLVQYKDCNFSMSGIKTQLIRHLIREEKNLNIAPDEIIPNVYDLCAGFLLIIARHLCHRVQRGIVFVESRGLIPSNNKTLVVSGGVACNNFIAKALKTVCQELGYNFARPPPKLCTDNGIMIAWNGVERWNANIGVLDVFDSVTIQKTAPLGNSIADEILKASISCKWVKLNMLNCNEAFK